MLVTVQAEPPVSRDERARMVRAVRLALEPFRPRVARATLRVRGAGAEGKALVQAYVPLGPAGVVRVEARGRGLRACTQAAIRRIAEAVARRLTAERQALLEYLFLASGATGEARRKGAASRRRAA